MTIGTLKEYNNFKLGYISYILRNKSKNIDIDQYKVNYSFNEFMDCFINII